MNESQVQGENSTLIMSSEVLADSHDGSALHLATRALSLNLTAELLEGAADPNAVEGDVSL